MSTDYWVPAEDRYEKARPKAARPTETFLTTGSMKAGAEQIDYGYLTLAHTSGDIYVFFKNVQCSCGGRRRIARCAIRRSISSPEPGSAAAWTRWIPCSRSRNEQTRIVPAYGPVMTKAEFKAERDMMEEVRARLFKQVREGDGPEGHAGGRRPEGPRPNVERSRTNSCMTRPRVCWAHHDKMDPNVV